MITFVFCCLAFFGTCIVCQDIHVVGCGGFIKSNVDIDFALIEVKLVSKQGVVKYKTDCAPVSGYYMIPVYDKAEYSLVVEPPKGWSFEPKQVDLTIDGTSDKCSKQEDINFQFTGFGILGNVISLGEERGPVGVKLELVHKKAGSSVLQTVTSSSDGSYEFSRVLPGQYTIRASHSTWLLEPSETDVSVTTSNGKASKAIKVLGYDVRGRVVSEGEPTKGVQLLLYSQTVTSLHARACDQTGVAQLPALASKRPLCHTTSSDTGHFVFPALPCGTYSLVPVHRGKNIKFDVVPTEMAFTVQHESLTLQQDFRVTGFSVGGRVLMSSKGAGVAGAEVKVNNDVTVHTQADGSFLLDSMKTAVYKIQVSARGLFFAPLEVKVTPNTPQLPDMVAERYDVCGSLRIDRYPERVSNDLSKRKVRVTKQGGDATELQVRADGSFCATLAPGTYTVGAVVSAHEMHAGLLLQPSERQVKVVDRPLDGIDFRQLRLRVRGRVSCLEKCKPLQLSLVVSKRADDKQIVSATLSADNSAEFAFTDVMPGQYDVMVLNDDWCWEHKQVSVQVKDTDVTDVKLTHTGYVFTCSVSHDDVTLEFVHDVSRDVSGEFKMSRGVSKFCLERRGVYSLHPRSCHRFEQDVYRFDTAAAPSVLSLNAVSHRVEGIVSAAVNNSDVSMRVVSSLSDEPVVLGPLKAVAAKSGFTYTFSVWAKAGEHLHVSPLSSSLLFEPPTRSLSVDGQHCVSEALAFEAMSGVFISGVIKPALSDVIISVTAEDELVASVTTDATGKYRVGPLHPSRQYDVTATREGYVLREDATAGVGSFTARRLAELAVTATDESGAPLAGVLLSLSAVGYRNNVLTPADGHVRVRSLEPGQYFVKLMMKEYVFTPASQTVTVEEGGDVTLSVSGKRVAYSVHGRVMSLNGEPEPALPVEAVGVESKACTAGVQEEGVTESDGRFHLRGLTPGCSYQLRIKPGAAEAAHIERTAPPITTLHVEERDIENVQVIAFRRMTRLDVSAHVNCSVEWLTSLRVSVYREGAHDSPVHTMQVVTPFVSLPPLSIDGRKYVIKLESSLSRALFDYALPEISFVANTSLRHFTLTFAPVRRSIEQEMNASSFLIIPLTLALVLLVYRHDVMLPVAANAVATITSLIAAQRTSAAASASHTPPPYDVTADLLNITKKKKPKKA